MEPNRSIRRQELWEGNYRTSRDLDHLSPQALSERIFDCMNNFRARNEQDQLGLLPIQIAEPWWIRITEVFHECGLRGYGYPGPINISRYGEALKHVFRPMPNMTPYLERLRGAPFIMKFGSSDWLPKALSNGKFLLSPASYYERHEHNHARRDIELSRKLLPNPRNRDANAFLLNRDLAAPQGKVLGDIEIRETYDYYLFSLTASYNSRLFGDFNADGCLVIFEPKIFLQRLIEALSKKIQGAQFEVGLVKYYDPVRTDPAAIDVPFWKPFSHWYQTELRLVCTLTDPVPTLPRLEFEIGSLRDCASLVIA